MSRVKKIIGILVFAAMLTQPVVALASTYWSKVWMYSYVRGETRWYNGSTMNISMTAHDANSGTFRVKLYRDGWIDDYIGYRDLNRNGAVKATWSSVGSGNYYFTFSKTDDGTKFWSDDVHMYN